jgi:RNA polymerase sigma factor (sigma-70 family)
MNALSKKHKFIEPPVHGPYAKAVWDHAKSDWTVSLNEAGRQFVEEQLRLFNYQPIKLLVRRYYSLYNVLHAAGFTDEDINIVCQAAFAKSATRFDPKHGLKFTTYATYYLRRQVQDSLLGNRRDREGNCSQVIQFNSTFNCMSLSEDERLVCTNPSFQDDPVLRSIRNEERAKLSELLKKLPKRQQQVIRLRRIQGLTLAKTGKILGGISKERVRQIESIALSKLKITREQLA